MCQLVFKDSNSEMMRLIESDVRTVEEYHGVERHHTIQDRLHTYRVPGVSIAVIRDFQLAWAKGYGLATPGRFCLDASQASSRNLNVNVVNEMPFSWSTHENGEVQHASNFSHGVPIARSVT